MTPEERRKIEQEICNLQQDLFTMVDGSADYHCLRFLDSVIRSDKFWELFAGTSLYYTREELTAILDLRQAKRDRIIELRELLENDESAAN